MSTYVTIKFTWICTKQHNLPYIECQGMMLRRGLGEVIKLWIHHNIIFLISHQNPKFSMDIHGIIVQIQIRLKDLGMNCFLLLQVTTVNLNIQNLGSFLQWFADSTIVEKKVYYHIIHKHKIIIIYIHVFDKLQTVRVKENKRVVHIFERWKKENTGEPLLDMTPVWKRNCNGVKKKKKRIKIYRLKKKKKKKKKKKMLYAIFFTSSGPVFKCLVHLVFQSLADSTRILFWRKWKSFTIRNDQAKDGQESTFYMTTPPLISVRLLSLFWLLKRWKF